MTCSTASLSQGNRSTSDEIARRGLRERKRSIHTRCITCTAHAPRAGALLRRPRRMRGAAPDVFLTLLDPTRPLLFSMATQGARWTQYTARIPRSLRTSRTPLPSTVRCARPALCIDPKRCPGTGAHARSRPTRAQVKDTAISTASLAELALEMLLHSGFPSWRSGTKERCLAARRRSMPVGSVADGTVG